MNVRSHALVCKVGLVLMIGAGLRGGAAETPGLTWPAEWKVFLPVEREAPIPSADELATIPERMNLDGTEIEGRWVEAGNVPELHGFSVNMENVRLDLAPLFGEVAVGNTAWVYLPVESDRAREATFGFGADWWLTAWLNGVEILDTTGQGNLSWPPLPDNHRVTAGLEEGLNVLAVRFVSGAGSSVLAVAGPEHLSALNRGPGRDQAYWSAREALDFSLPEVDLGRGTVTGVEPLPSRQLLYAGERGGRHRALDRQYPRFEEPVRLLLSKSVYPAEDRHLDAVAWLTPEEAGAAPSGHLEVVLRGADGGVLAENRIEDLAGFRAGLFFSVGFPGGLVGGRGELELRWVGEDGAELGTARGAFEVSAPSDVARSGRVGLSISNASGAVLERAPFTVGVPFPQGALLEPDNVRLVDEGGAEVPLQARVSARWSRYGYVRWLLCDFTADLDGGPRSLSLEYGPGISRASAAPIVVREDLGGGFPSIDAGRLRVRGGGLSYDVSGAGDYRAFLEGGALSGEFVEHADGRRFTVPGDAVHEIEEHGSEKVVVRRVGWYGQEDGEGEFCNYITRLVFHRDSPVVRIYHTWIFTGDGNRDRIRNMGWRFPLAEGLAYRGFLSSLRADGAWEGGESLVQWNYDAYDLVSGGERSNRAGGSAPGVAAAGGEGAHLLFGVKDFWQNFPSELEFSDNAFTFYNWPAHNRPEYHERPVEVGHAYRLRFAHEGELLDFRLPEEYVQEPIWRAMAGQPPGSTYSNSIHYDLEKSETANAQGIARTEEMFLYLAGGDVSREEGVRVMQGLNDETLRAVVDPAWVAASGAFGRIHHRDTENFPEEERVYELINRAPARWADRLGIYGMWIFGDIAAWNMNLHARTSSPYRAYRKNHHGWPFRWTPFARSGDSWLLRYAEASTRQMVDTAFCHYASADVDEAVGTKYNRRQGWYFRTLLPWAGGIRGPNLRTHGINSDYLWDNYYLTGFRRPKDVALLYGRLVRDENPLRPVNGTGRGTNEDLNSYLDMYRATFDPWFLVALHALGEVYNAHEALGGPDFWRPAASKFIEFTGCPKFTARYIEATGPGKPAPDPEDAPARVTARYIEGRGLANRTFGHEQSIGWHGSPRLRGNAFAWHLTGLDYNLGRLEHELDSVRAAVYEGEPDYLRGHSTSFSHGQAVGNFTGFYIQEFPYALGTLAAAGKRVGPVANSFFQRPVSMERETDGDGELFRVRPPEVAFLKESGREVALFFRAWRPVTDCRIEYSIIGPDGEEAFAGSWPARETRDVIVPADAPAGVYRARMEGLLSRVERAGGEVFVPYAFYDVPEVFLLERTERGTSVYPNRRHPGPESQYWFRVPEGVERFRVDFRARTGQPARMSVWNPDGVRAWDRNHFEPGVEGAAITDIRAEVEVDSKHAGKLWRITFPGGMNRGFELDPQIPPVFSVSRDKWFDPDSDG